MPLTWVSFPAPLPTAKTAVWLDSEAPERDFALKSMRRARIRLEELADICPMGFSSYLSWTEPPPTLDQHKEMWKAVNRMYRMATLISEEVKVAGMSLYKKPKTKMSKASTVVFDMANCIEYSLPEGIQGLEESELRPMFEWFYASMEGVDLCIAYLEYGGFEASSVLPDNFEEDYNSPTYSPSDDYCDSTYY